MKSRPSIPPFLPRAPREAELWTAIAAHDDMAREVYADWLEGNSLFDDAAFVRAQVRGDAQEIADLAVRTRPSWRVHVARPPIENCAKLDVPKFAFQCPREWGGLQPTADPSVKFCTACRESVYYCTNVVDARGLAKKGKCVAIDATAERWTDDLAAKTARHCPHCKGDLGSFSGDRCPSCDGAVRVVMKMGRMRVV
ncbi:MAG: TIGR02996 domain-containing protein [Kofleriaceae bacterium]